MKNARIAMLLLLFVLLVTAVGVLRAQNAMANSTLCQTGCLLSPTGLLGWWPGDGTSNDIQLGHNGVATNGATFAPGLVRQAFLLDGVDDFIEVPDSPAFHAITTAVTVDAWINPQLPVPPSGEGYSEGWIFARRDPLISDGIDLRTNSDGYVMVDLVTDAGPSFLASTEPVVQYNGQWKHIALTADTSTGQVNVYLNGKPVALTAVEGSPTVSGRFADVNHLFIGQRQNAEDEGAYLSMRYKGLIDEVEVFNRALSLSEIQAIYFVGSRGKCKP